MKLNVIFSLLGTQVLCLNLEFLNISLNYFLQKEVKYISIFSCLDTYANKLILRKLLTNNIRLSGLEISQDYMLTERFLHQWDSPVGVLLDLSCNHSQVVLEQASQQSFFDAAHVWLVFLDDHSTTIEQYFGHLNLSVDADITVVKNIRDRYRLTEVFNFGRIQGNPLEINEIGMWGDNGLNIPREFKYYRRWDFRNLTLRAIAVIVDKPKAFHPDLLLDMGYTLGVAAMTKVAAQLLDLLRQQHNFRFNYTIAGRWIGAPERNSTLAVTNSLFWREQDISCTCARIYPKWMEWVDIFFPPATKLETKFYYLIPNKGVGEYENRFLTPLSPGVWWCSGAALLACAAVLAGAAYLERRPKPGFYALFSVVAALCQQAYEDGFQILEEFSNQGRRTTLLVIGMTSMLLYNYYTSSVVSWLLNAAAPSIDSIQGLMVSDLELVFENIGYAKQWLDNPGFYYFAGYKNMEEDELRDKKVTRATRTTAILQSAEAGIELLRHGAYAFHTEPYTASQVIARSFEDRELCALGSLQMMPPSRVYIMGQKRSPYGQFFIWSMMRLQERGHIRVSRERVGGKMPACSGRTPRALALGQAAPAFSLLLQMMLLAVIILLMEIIWQRFVRREQEGQRPR